MPLIPLLPPGPIDLDLDPNVPYGNVAFCARQDRVLPIIDRIWPSKGGARYETCLEALSEILCDFPRDPVMEAGMAIPKPNRADTVRGTADKVK